jgi:predicted dehydrogenase
VIALPILVQPDMVRKALEAGKHVLSEKPIADEIATAEQLISWYEKLEGPLIWAVAENFCFMRSVAVASEALKRLGGTLVTFYVNMYTLMPEESPYLIAECEFVRTDAEQGLSVLLI